MGIDHYKSSEILKQSQRLLLCLLLCLSLSASVNDSITTAQETEGESDLYTTLAPLLAQELCDAIAQENNLDLELSERADFSAEVAASILQLKEHTTIPEAILNEVERYQQESLRLEQEGTLITIVNPDRTPVTLSRMERNEADNPLTCSLVSVNLKGATRAQQAGVYFHERVHAVQFDETVGADQPEQTYDEKEPVAEYYQHLITYGANLSEQADRQPAENQNFYEATLPSATVFLAEQGVQATDIFVRYLYDRLLHELIYRTAESYTAAIASYREIIAIYSDMPESEKYTQDITSYQATIEEYEEELRNTESKLRAFSDDWRDYQLSARDTELLAQMIETNVLPPNFQTDFPWQYDFYFDENGIAQQ